MGLQHQSVSRKKHTGKGNELAENTRGSTGTSSAVARKRPPAAERVPKKLHIVSPAATTEPQIAFVRRSRRLQRFLPNLNSSIWFPPLHGAAGIDAATSHLSTSDLRIVWGPFTLFCSCIPLAVCSLTVWGPLKTNMRMLYRSSAFRNTNCADHSALLHNCSGRNCAAVAQQPIDIGVHVCMSVRCQDMFYSNTLT